MLKKCQGNLLQACDLPYDLEKKFRILLEFPNCEIREKFILSSPYLQEDVELKWS